MRIEVHKMKIDFVSVTKILMLSLTMMAMTILMSQENAKAQEGKSLFLSKGCIACHGPEGKGVANIKNTPYPRLAGQNPTYLLNQLKALKSGARKGAMAVMMQPFAMTMSAAEMKKISDYLGAVK